MAHKKQTFYVLADAHGIESFTPTGDNFGMMNMRAQLNRQRHAVAFQAVFLDGYALRSVKNLLKKSNWKKALVSLKLAAMAGKVEIGIPAGNAGYEKSLALIPNSDLDPWGGS